MTVWYTVNIQLHVIGMLPSRVWFVDQRQVRSSTNRLSITNEGFTRMRAPLLATQPLGTDAEEYSYEEQRPAVTSK